MPEKLKSVCFRCQVSKWIVDFRGGCAANISAVSVCLSCEQSEKIEKLEMSLRVKDGKIRALEDMLSKLAKKVDNLIKTKKACESKDSGHTVNNVPTVNEDSPKVSTQCSMQMQGAEVGVDGLRGAVLENIDNIVESGRDIVEIRRDIVEIRQEIASIKGDDFQKVIGKKSARGSPVKKDKGILLTNRFAVLSEEESYLIGDSLVREQTENFANHNKRRRTVRSFPGCRVRRVTEEVRKLQPQSSNSCIITHAGSNDLFSRATKDRYSEPIVKDLETMVNAVAEKTTKGVVLGILPRRYANYYTLSKAIGINARIKKYCGVRKVEFLDLWDSFIGKWHYFRKDGIHLNEAGHKKLGEILNKECERLMSIDKNSVKASSDKSSSQDQDVSGSGAPQVLNESDSESLEFSFIGFPKEN